MTLSRGNRKVYSAEELHRLRKLQSQPKLREAIEEHEREDADIVKEHVLRGSKSFAARSFRSRASAASLRIPGTKSNNENFLIGEQDVIRRPAGSALQAGGAILGEIAPNGQILRQGTFKLGPSPTPSIKKKKAEAIVKAHGSPTHVRVTAGGRIVPSEQSPLCHPRYGYSAIRTNGGLIKFAPNHHAGNPQWTRATEDGFVAQDMHGNLCQIVNGTILPLTEIDGTLRLYMPAPNLKVTQRRSSQGAVGAPFAPAGSQNQVSGAPRTDHTQAAEPPVASQITALELEYAKLEHELKDVDRTEVIHGRTMGKVAKEALIAKRRELVINLDKIRKALKELKNRPPPNAPTSPRAMLNGPSMSPPRNRLPAFLKPQQASNVMPAPAALATYSQYYAAAGPVSQYNVQPVTLPDEVYSGQSWNMPPPSMFVPPPPFDGSMTGPFAAFAPAEPPVPTAPVDEQVAATTIDTGREIPQDDGTRSSTEHHAASPNRSRAVSIRAPEPRSAIGVKSCLNPMSPVYKPAAAPCQGLSRKSDPVSQSVKGRVPTPLQPPTECQKVPAANDEIISPSKRAVHLHSSSISSFDTADFFPRNTREYSTRRYAYPFRPNQSDDKENTTPEKGRSPFTPSPRDHGATAIAPDFKGNTPQTVETKPPVAPPGTPVQQADLSNTSLPQSRQLVDLPNRETHNVSPKSKREWVFVQENPGQPSSSGKSRTSQNKICAAAGSYDLIDFSQKPCEWIEGYQAGLQRQAISADRMGKFLDGYCAGLLKSKAPANTSPTAAPSNGSPVKPISRRPAQALPSQSSNHLQAKQALETGAESLDTLKQVIFAPQNEEAVLTPATDGPHISETSRNLGAWARAQHASVNAICTASNPQTDNVANYFVPPRTTPPVSLPGFASGNDIAYEWSDKTLPPEPQQDTDSSCAGLQPGHAFDYSDKTIEQPSSPYPDTNNVALSSISSGAALNIGNRITSMTGISSNMHRQWPGSRIMTPTEWKSGSSVAHAAGLATGYFTNVQLDGAAKMQRMGSVTGTSTAAERHGRFREGSLDGITNPPTSPTVPMSPRISPQYTPVRECLNRKDFSPGKGPSPTKAKFEHIAGKVGIKIASATGKNQDAHTSTFEPSSPPDKRRWRDIWRKGGKEGTE